MDKYNFNIQLKEGDPAAYQKFYRVTFPRMIGYCKLFIHNSDQAEDLVQECFLKFWENRNSIQPERSAESLLFIMLRNRCLNYLRDQKLSKEQVVSLSADKNELQHLFQLDFLEREERSLEEELFEAISKAIDNFPQKRKIVFIKAKLEGKKNSDIARELGISLKAVEKHISQAKTELRREMIAKFPMLSTFIIFLLR